MIAAVSFAWVLKRQLLRICRLALYRLTEMDYFSKNVPKKHFPSEKNNVLLGWHEGV